jgi:cytochrome c553
MRNPIKQLLGVSILSCIFAAAIPMHGEHLSKNAVAGSSESTWNTTIQPSKVGVYDRADEDKGAPEKPNAANAGAAPKADTDAHAGLVNEESLYPTAAQCGECHKQIYEEWASSNHAYAAISPMFHKFEQKFQELTQGTVGTFCVRCHQQVGTQLGDLHHVPPGQGAVRQGQWRAPDRAGHDPRARLRQRRKERDQGCPRRQG